MPIAPSKSTGAKGSDSGNRYLSTGDSRLSATLTSVPATHSVIVTTCAVIVGVTTGNLVSGVTVGGTSATVVGSRLQVNNAGARHEIVRWIVPNVSAGDKAIVISLVNASTEINWHGDSWPIAVSGAYDVGASNSYGAGVTTVNVPNSGVTGTLAQAVELVLATVMAKFTWQWGSTYGEPGDPPSSGYTTLADISIDNLNSVSFQTAYKETSAVTGVSASWTKTIDGDTPLALLQTFRISTVQRRLKVLAGSAMNGLTGITLHAWSGNPKDVLAQEWTGLTAQASGGILYTAGTAPPAGWTTGSIVNCIAYQPAGSKGGTSYVQGIVEEF